MKKIITLVSLLCWIWLGIISFGCTPNFEQKLGIYKKSKSYLEENITNNYDGWVSSFYQPISWLVDPSSEMELNTFHAISILVGFGIFGLMLKYLLSDEPQNKASWGFYIIGIYVISYVILGTI